MSRGSKSGRLYWESTETNVSPPWSTFRFNYLDSLFPEYANLIAQRHRLSNPVCRPVPTIGILFPWLARWLNFARIVWRTPLLIYLWKWVHWINKKRSQLGIDSGPKPSRGDLKINRLGCKCFIEWALRKYFCLEVTKEILVEKTIRFKIFKFFTLIYLILR